MLLNKLIACGRLGGYQLTDAQLREAFQLIDQGLAEAALFKETPRGSLISLHEYFYAIDDKRFMNGFCSQIYQRDSMRNPL